MTAAPVLDFAARLETARRARARLATRPVAATVRALAAAAVRWREDAALARALPAASSLSPEMIAAVLPLAAEALDADAMAALVEAEWGSGALERGVPPGAGLVAHVLASNVPALALPAIALACLAGAPVLVKSGRHVRLSADAFVRALAAVDPDLAATVVTTYWTGGDLEAETALEQADVVVATGSEPAVAALAGRLGRTVLAHGPRVSVAAIGREPALDVETLARRLALDVVLHDQRGCLSPHGVWIERGGGLDPRDFATHLATALGELARGLPAGPAPIEERAAARSAREEAEWDSEATVIGGDAGTVIYDDRPRFRAGAGRRTIRVQPLDDLAGLPDLLPVGAVECVGIAGADCARLAPALAARGVSRLCPLGRMQRPSLAWPRGRQPPLGALLGRRGPAPIQVEP